MHSTETENQKRNNPVSALLYISLIFSIVDRRYKIVLLHLQRGDKISFSFYESELQNRPK